MSRQNDETPQSPLSGRAHSDAPDSTVSPSPIPFPRVRRVGLGAPLRWVALGAGDLKACPRPSLFYGFCFAAMGLLVTMVFRRAYEYTFALTTGFLLLGPFLAMGLYEISRRREQGVPAALAPTLTVWRRNAGNIGVFVLVLGIVFLVWARASMIVFALFYTSELPSLSGFIGQVASLQNLEFLAVYFGVGLVFAAIVFAASVVSIPLMLDRNQDAVSAVIASFNALRSNPGPMLIWAFLIVSLTGIGFLSFHVGLVVTMPIIGHASWHAYRELVEPPHTP